ncbi:MAG: FHA domain-containing protein [Acidobacteriota bacterium]|nr:FHA domain-containing protein [Blastocatellia bacterium]MDW8411227.1 FHA domain-containing protein [Acidobacteriota bacterium]
MSNLMMIKLQAKNSSSGEVEAGKLFPTELDKVSIGRHPDSFIHLNAAHISKEHAVILRRSDGYFLIDRSTNGTLLNGVRIERERPMPIKPGDRISIAEFQIDVLDATDKNGSSVEEQQEDEIFDTPSSFGDVIKAIDAGEEASYLVYVGGERDGQRIELRGSTSEVLVGRSRNCHVFINHPAIAPMHAKVRMDWAGIAVYDLNVQQGSGSGVFVNGVRITSSRRLRNGDEISFGIPVSAGGVKLILYDRNSLSTENLLGLPPPITTAEPENKPSSVPVKEESVKAEEPAKPEPKAESKETGQEAKNTEDMAEDQAQDAPAASGAVALLDLNRQIYAGITLREALTIVALLLLIVVFCIIAFSFLGI